MSNPSNRPRPTPVIITMQDEHLADIAALEVGLFDRGLGYDALQSLAKGIAFRGYVIIGDDPAGQPIAYILAHVTGAVTGGFAGEILSLGTDPAFHRRGLASALCQHLIDELAGQSGQSALFLEVAADNHAAQQLYNGLGFHQIAVRPDYYKRADGVIDAIVMRRDDV